jgi:mevalonate kinase
MSHYYAHGKLLLSGEYVVLHGATALALPTLQGQSLKVHPAGGASFRWTALEQDGRPWLQASFDPEFLNLLDADDIRKAKVIQSMLRTARQLNRDFGQQLGATQAITQLHFDKDWGLGSSSSLVGLIAQWAQVDPYALFDRHLTGSGYDVACAMQEKPLLYQRKGANRSWQSIEFKPEFRDRLRFVYLGHKQYSDLEVKQFMANGAPSQSLIDEVSGISLALAQADTLDNFAWLLDQHEQLIGNLLQRTPIGQSHFKGFPGTVKSLGAWGGDFVLTVVPDPQAAEAWLQAHDYTTVLQYDQLFP